MIYQYKNDPCKKLVFSEDRDLQLKISMVHFTEEIEIRDCIVRDFEVFGVYCIRGLSVRNTTFDCEIIWQSGGHNTRPIVFENCVFKRFVDFEDCDFEDEFILRNVTFIEGTNLLGNKGTPVEVSFSRFPLLDNVNGTLTIDSFK
ncbi:pentapeptide repeat-containing protein [Oligoflexus tunisiensis]|uniref:pentapeptide repeat-containing protein n=1 Tax=Oligoflexus tunisiensis TaxID=708132 RepID=UPI00114C8B9D|nr:pentapeptide repeat-containing protein [Oligoflexus tunisiensis]